MSRAKENGPKKGTQKSKILRNKSTQPVASKNVANIPRAIPSAYVNPRVTKSARILPMKNGDILVRHTEYVQDISVINSVFNIFFSGGVNPGNPSLFPWLSRIAPNYESYEFRKLNFNYEPLIGTNSSGRVLMALDYDVTDDAPQSKQQMMSYSGAVGTPFYGTSLLEYSKRDASTLTAKRFTRYAAIPANTDPKTYDVANLFVATVGTSSAIVGELYVSYEVILSTPQLQAAIPAAKIEQGQTPTPTFPFGSVAGTASILGAIASVTNGSSSRINFNRIGEYIIDTVVNGTGIGAISVSPGGSATAVSEFVTKNAADTSITSTDSVKVTQLPAYLDIFLTNQGTVSTAVSRISPYVYAWS